MISEEIYLSTNYEIEVFERCFNNRLPLLIKGPTGCGKSQFVQYMGQRLKVPIVKVSCNEDTSSSDLLGRYIIKGAETIWQDGPVTRAVRQGGLLYLDEIAEAREDVIVALHPLTDHRREIYLDKVNETVKAPSHFMVIASFNPGYQHGFKELKPSTRQRFVNLSMTYLPEEKEMQLLLQLTNVNPTVAKKLVILASRIRNLSDFQLKETVSTRLLVYAAHLIQDGMNARKACHVAIAETLSDDLEITQALKDTIDLMI